MTEDGGRRSEDKGRQNPEPQTRLAAFGIDFLDTLP